MLPVADILADDGFDIVLINASGFRAGRVRGRTILVCADDDLMDRKGNLDIGDDG